MKIITKGRFKEKKDNMKLTFDFDYPCGTSPRRCSRGRFTEKIRKKSPLGKRKKKRKEMSFQSNQPKTMCFRSCDFISIFFCTFLKKCAGVFLKRRKKERRVKKVFVINFFPPIVFFL